MENLKKLIVTLDGYPYFSRVGTDKEVCEYKEEILRQINETSDPERYAVFVNDYRQ